MATTFNFTVRAEDDQGAFADRDFSINVRNTVVDRYMIIDSTDAYTSPDLENWTKRSNQGGTAVNYGGGKWLITAGQSTNGLYRVSSDGVNFETRTISAPMIGATQWITNHDIVWNDGYWWVHCSVAGSQWTGYRYVLIRSSDGLTWESVITHAVSSAAPINPTFHDGKVYLVFNGSIYAIDTTANPTTITQFTPTLPTMALGSGGISVYPPLRINGLWILPRHSPSAYGNHYSADGINWSAGEVVGAPGSRSYNQTSYFNGVLFTQYTMTGSASVSGPLISVDGKTWSMPNIGTSSAISFGNKSILFMAKGKVHLIVASIRRVSSDLGSTWQEYVLPISAVTGFAMVR